MGHQLNQYGEEYLLTTNVDGVTIDVGIYNDDTDAMGDADDVGALSTEPTNSAYARQSATLAVDNPTGTDVVANNDSAIQFDFSDQSTSEMVDSYFVVATFQSDVVDGESGSSDHLIMTGALSQDRDIGSVDILELSAGAIELEPE